MVALMQKAMIKTHNGRQEMILKLTQQPQVEHQLMKSKTRTLEIGFSNKENSTSIINYGKAKPKVVEKSKNNKCRWVSIQAKGTRRITIQKKTETQQPWYNSLGNSKQIFTNLVE